MRSNNRYGLLVAGASLLLAGCGSDGALPPPQSPHAAVSGSMVADVPMQIGAPFQVEGKSYTPEDAPAYDEVGYAGIYDPEGSETANGERFVAQGVSAAHKTLPLPSYVEVTSLDTGKTIVVRVNDRGPMTNGRIVDLSPGAAEQLGIAGGSPAPVRVRRVNPPEQERAVLRAHGRAAERLETPAPLLAVLRERLEKAPVATAAPPPQQPSKPPAKPRPNASVVPPAERPVPPAPRPVPSSNGNFIVEQVPTRAPAPAAPAASRGEARVRSSGGYVVQVAAFSSQTRAEALARRIGAGASRAGNLWRVRLGPYPTQAAAQQGVHQAAAKGFENARIMANDPR